MNMGFLSVQRSRILKILNMKAFSDIQDLRCVVFMHFLFQHRFYLTGIDRSCFSLLNFLLLELIIMQIKNMVSLKANIA